MQAGNYGVILDSCVLANFPVCDLYLRLAESPRLYVPLWSKEILDETQRTHTSALGWEPSIAESFRRALETAFPEAMVRDYATLTAILENEAKDRHVLAAAIKGRATTVVTFNLRHFPVHALRQWDVEARHPSDYLLTLYAISPRIVIRRVREIAAKRNESVAVVLTRLALSCPGFAAQLLKDLE